MTDLQEEHMRGAGDKAVFVNTFEASNTKS
jgi:hypothetical protein